MQASEAGPGNRFALAKRSMDWAETLGRLKAFVIATVGRRSRAKGDTIPHYEGYGWCDSLEGQVNSDIATGRRPRL